MQELQDIYVRYKRHVQQLLTGVKQPPLPTRELVSISTASRPGIGGGDGGGWVGGAGHSLQPRAHANAVDENGILLVRIPDTFMEFDAEALQRRREHVATYEGAGSGHDPGPSDTLMRADSRTDTRHALTGGGGRVGERQRKRNRDGVVRSRGKMPGDGVFVGEGGVAGGGKRKGTRQFQQIIDNEGNLVEVADHMSCLVCLGSVSADLWVACDTCGAWQHQLCAGYLAEDDVPDKHYCEECRAAQASAEERSHPYDFQGASESLSQAFDASILPSADKARVGDDGVEGGQHDNSCGGSEAQEASYSKAPQPSVAAESTDMYIDREAVYARGGALYAATGLPDTTLTDLLLPGNVDAPISPDVGDDAAGGDENHGQGAAEDCTIEKATVTDGEGTAETGFRCVLAGPLPPMSTSEASCAAPPAGTVAHAHTQGGQPRLPDTAAGTAARIRNECALLSAAVASMKESALCEEVEALLRDAEARVEDLETVMADELAATHQPEPPPTPPPTDPVWATLGPRASDTRRREAEVMTMIQVISHH